LVVYVESRNIIKMVVKVTGKKPNEKLGRKRPTLYINIPPEVADAMGIKMNDYLALIYDGENLILKKLNI